MDASGKDIKIKFHNKKPSKKKVTNNLYCFYEKRKNINFF